MIIAFNMLKQLNHEEIGKNLRRISKTKPFISKYKWKGIN